MNLNQRANQVENETVPSLLSDDIGHRYVFNPNVSPAAVIEQYRSQAADYEKNMQAWGFLTPQQSTQILGRFVPHEAKILEAGCGTCMSDALHHAAGFTELHGFDLSPEMLELAAQKGIHRSLKCGNLLERLPYLDGEFDAAVCVAVLTHITDAEPLLRELARVVRPGGHIIFSQRKDLFETRKMGEMLAKLEQEQLITKIYQSEWLPYVTNHKAYVDCGIVVGYFVYAPVYSGHRNTETPTYHNRPDYRQ
jgi:ubiquinone/menaquinone biosynthesis C-methylase UbiE